MLKLASKMVRPVILCGGQGTRLWPVSRSSFPKQFARMFTEKSMFQETLSLVSDEKLFRAPIIVGAEKFEHILLSHLKELGIQNAELILETDGRNTAAAVALACAVCHEDEILLVMPSDHRIEDKNQFRKDVKNLCENANNGDIGIFGVSPNHASTDYGYIEIGEPANWMGSVKYNVTSFNEKPDFERATKFLKTGKHFWNAGIFLFKAKTMIDELHKFAPDILRNSFEALKNGEKRNNVHYTNPDIFAMTPALPIDIAVMEKTDRSVVALAQFDWLDIGSWKSYADICEQDDAGNCIDGPVFLEDCSENIIHAEGKLVTVIGLEGHAIIDTDDALLIMPKERAGQLSSIVKKMKRKGVVEASNHLKVRRPWGSFKGIHHGVSHQVKHIVVKPDEKLSYQYHYHRAEHWIIVKGAGLITVGEKEMTLHENDSVYIPVGTPHRLHNPYDEELHLIEVQYGDYLGEDDIVRLDDIYGRVPVQTKKTVDIVGEPS